ncbi:MAG: hypothetical protein HKN25_09180 [Pyrinomonadaceae bacterium]|nr:hypothetical protein [Pyrinomonadaceae bacterium]
MTCWQCKSELSLVYEAADYTMKLYHCDTCERWYEMKKDKEKVNSSVPIKFFELDSPPQIPTVI